MHKDIGKQKFRVKTAYTTWVEYDVVANSPEQAEEAVLECGGIERVVYKDGFYKGEEVEVSAQDWNSDYTGDLYTTHKIAECIPIDYEDGVDYDDYEWSTDEWEWKKEHNGKAQA
jgi:hypothetical protein